VRRPQYGRPLPGTPSSLPRIDRAMISDRHAEVWTRARLQIVVSGDIGAQELGTRLERLLDGMPQGQPVPDPVLPPAREPSGVARIRVKRRQNQAVVLVGWPGPHSANERRVPLMLMREALNGQSGRLFEALRNRRSLCYNTGILGTAGFGQGMLAAYVLTAPDTADAARDALVAEVSRLADTPVGADEFTRVRDRLLGNLLIAVQANAARAARAARARIYARGPDDLQDLVAAIRACTPDEVLEAAATYVSPTARYDVVLGP